MTKLYQSEEINELALALSKAQGEMLPAIKDKKNPFFKSSYADLGSVWDAARPALTKNGLSVIQTTEHEGHDIVLVTTLAHSSGQWMKSYLPLLLSKLDSQGIGSAMTYLRRYSLSALIGVVSEEDDDGNAACESAKPGKEPKNFTPAKPDKSEVIDFVQFTDLTEALNSCSPIDATWLRECLRKAYKIEDLSLITQDIYVKMMPKVCEKRDAHQKALKEADGKS